MEISKLDSFDKAFLALTGKGHVLKQDESLNLRDATSFGPEAALARSLIQNEWIELARNKDIFQRIQEAVTKGENGEAIVDESILNAVLEDGAKVDQECWEAIKGRLKDIIRKAASRGSGDALSKIQEMVQQNEGVEGEVKQVSNELIDKTVSMVMGWLKLTIKSITENYLRSEVEDIRSMGVE